MADDDFESFSGLSPTLEGLSRRTRGLEAGATSFARAMTQAFSRAVVDGKRFEDVLKSLALRLSDLSLKLALKPLEKSLASGISSLFAGMFGSSGGKPALFADGGVIAAPSFFRMPGGQVGLAGEAGPEAILPLARGSDGRLGVATSGGHAPVANVTINIATPDAASFRNSEAYVTGLIARAVARGQRSL